MYNETIDKLSNAAVYKANFCKNRKFSYIISSALAGAFIGTGVLSSFISGALISTSESPATKLIMGLTFTIALTLVIFTGTELFTGNNLIMTIGKLDKKISFTDLINVWIYSWIGNLLGAIILSIIFVISGLVSTNPSAEFFGEVAKMKATIPVFQLFGRAILCNFIVCLAVLITTRTQNDAAKILLIIMCLFTFVVSGFEHSIANMTVFSIALFAKNITTITFGQAIYSLIIATIGNIIGGVFFVGCSIYTFKTK
ncbi:formate/nitrite transporter family protein [Peptostreptococcus canis]|uniref:Formate/nitrite transporter family protein n=1 Tax=Peptostreptococcus canis TaxID=1159213 RepID=A0ABR6TJZ1_9FIRM|nr:formate/nitrite transporter family protein [Peptostreptococcus canis]MBC2575321.1 formate/nitrite transporter family protein [Peptostreptococcus canis]MBP1997496.1 nitrite transporter NirC [Peptostreptococcus canis]